jgi:hypothetical protein
MESLCEKLLRQISYRNDKITALCGQSGNTYERLAEISRHIELLTAGLRDSLIDCHNELQALGYCPPELPVPDAPEVIVGVDEKSVRIVVDGMLPYPLKGGACYLHDKLDADLMRYARDNALPRPLFDERCAVVFIHRYADTGRELRHLRDYDNTERRCITNVIARHFLRDDSPACYISMDVLAPGESNHTEIRLMTIDDFQAFTASDEIKYLPEGTVSKNTPKLYQKT